MKKNKHKKHQSYKTSKKDNSLFSNPIFLFGVSLSVVLVFYVSYSAFATSYLSLSGSMEREEARNLQALSELQKIASVPTETPIVRVIDNANLLKKDIAFYRDAQPGDFVFLFPTTEQVVIYRQSENKVINFGPLISSR
jgi:hypothetical protein